MSKADQVAHGRNEGMTFALKICKDAKNEGRDPVEALEKEVAFRLRTKIEVLATTKELDRASETMKETTIKTMLAAALIVLWEQFRFGHIRGTRFRNAFITYVAALYEQSITWYEITDLLKDKLGIDIDLSQENILGKGETYSGR